MGFVHLKSVLKCSNILNVKLVIMIIYFYKKTNIQRTFLMSCGTTLKECIFSHGTTSSCGEMIGYRGNKKL